MDWGHELCVVDRGEEGVSGRTGEEGKAEKGALLGVSGPH